MVAGAGGRPHAWERWLPAWHALFAFSMLVTNGLAISAFGIDDPRVWAALGVSAALVAWYWTFFVRVPPWQPPVWQMVVYVAGLLLAWSLLVRLSPTFLWLQATVFPQLFFALPIRLAAVASFVFAALVYLADPARSAGGSFDIAGVLGAFAVVAVFVLLSAWIAAIIDQSAERGRLIRELEETRRELAAMERQAGTLEERGRLAREIHDTLAQGFTSIVMHLEAADAALGRNAERVRHHLAEARSSARQSLAESRRSLAALRPEALESSSLAETLQRVVRDWANETGVRATLTVVGTPRDAGPDVDVTLLRAAQEALANVRKHARATEVTATLSYLRGEVALDVHDDGIGFEATVPRPSAEAGSGLGLRGMRERVERAGGSVAVESAPGRGTTVAVALPSREPGAASAVGDAPPDGAVSPR